MGDLIKSHKETVEEIRQVYLTKHISKIKKLLFANSQYINNVLGIFVKKSILKEDPYGYQDNDNKNEFHIPGQAPIVEGNFELTFHTRLTQLKNAYAYLATQKLTTIDDLTESFLEDARKVLETVNFSNLSFPNTNTRLYKELLDSIYAKKKPELSNILKMNHDLVVTTHTNINLIIAELSRFYRLIYKFTIRFEVFPILPKEDFSQKLFEEKPDVYLEKLSLFMETGDLTIPFIRYYIYEAINDCYYVNAEETIESFRNQYLSDGEAKKLSISPRGYLLRSINILASQAIVLVDIKRILTVNYKLYSTSRKNFFQVLIEYVLGVFRVSLRQELIEIQYFDPELKKYTTRNILFELLEKDFDQMIEVMQRLAEPNSPFIKKLEGSSLKETKKYLSTLYIRLFSLKEMIIGLENELLTFLKVRFVNLDILDQLKSEIDGALVTVYQRQKDYHKIIRM